MSVYSVQTIYMKIDNLDDAHVPANLCSGILEGPNR
jgi:hypothetical protein